MQLAGRLLFRNIYSEEAMLLADHNFNSRVQVFVERSFWSLSGSLQ
jgi:hypothetical protein